MDIAWRSSGAGYRPGRARDNSHDPEGHSPQSTAVLGMYAQARHHQRHQSTPLTAYLPWIGTTACPQSAQAVRVLRIECRQDLVHASGGSLITQRAWTYRRPGRG